MGVAPIGSLSRVASAAAQLVAIPGDQMRRNGPSAGAPPLSRQLQRGFTGLAKAVTLEALALGATMAGGAQHILAGGAAPIEENPASEKSPLFIQYSCPLWLQGSRALSVFEKVLPVLAKSGLNTAANLVPRDAKPQNRCA